MTVAVSDRQAGVDEFVAVGSLRLRVRRTGEGPGLLLINGIGAALDMWSPFASLLTGREVITFDLPGCGSSPAPRRPLRIRGLAELVAEMLDRLGQPQLDVLGYSFGGLVAQELAHRAPARVRRLVLCATTPGMPGVPPGPLVTAMMLSPARYYSESLGAIMVRHIAGGRTARDPQVLRAGLARRQTKPPSLVGYSHQLLAATGWTSQPWLHRLRQPTLVVHGDEDPVAALINARWMAHLIPRAEMRVIAGGGHLFLLDEPESSARIISAYLDRPAA